MVRTTLAAFLTLFISIHPIAAEDGAAVLLLERMGTALAGASQLAFEAEVRRDERVAGRPLVELQQRVRVLASRSGGFWLETSGQGGGSQVWYDGSAVTVMDGERKVYASSGAPPGLEAALDYTAQVLGVELPLADFVYGDLAAGPPGMGEMRYVGPAMVRGWSCHQIAVDSPGASWQIWIEDGPTPLPRKLVVTLRGEGSPRYSATFVRWNLAPDLPRGVFEFTPPEGAVEGEFLPRDATAARSGLGPSGTAPGNVRPSLRGAILPRAGVFDYRRLMGELHRYGRIVDGLPVGSMPVVIDGELYSFFGGIFYEKAPTGYVVVPAPRRAVVNEIPAGAVAVTAGEGRYFYQWGSFYRKHADLDVYEVVAPPTGATVPFVPDGYALVDLGGKKHFVLSGVYYRPMFLGGELVYIVTKVE